MTIRLNTALLAARFRGRIDILQQSDSKCIEPKTVHALVGLAPSGFASGGEDVR